MAKWPCILKGMTKLLPPELRAHVENAYLTRDLDCREIVDELAREFKVQLTSAQIRQWVSRRGLAAKRRELNRQVHERINESAIASLAAIKSAKPEELFEEWSRKLVGLAEKSLDTATKSERVRDLASAMSAVSTAIKLYRNVTGTDTPAPKTPFVFDYNFASSPLIRRVNMNPMPEARLVMAC